MVELPPSVKEAIENAPEPPEETQTIGEAYVSRGKARGGITQARSRSLEEAAKQGKIREEIQQREAFQKELRQQRQERILEKETTSKQRFVESLIRKQQALKGDKREVFVSESGEQIVIAPETSRVDFGFVPTVAETREQQRIFKSTPVKRKEFIENLVEKQELIRGKGRDVFVEGDKIITAPPSSRIEFSEAPTISETREQQRRTARRKEVMPFIEFAAEKIKGQRKGFIGELVGIGGDVEKKTDFLSTAKEPTITSIKTSFQVAKGGIGIITRDTATVIRKGREFGGLPAETPSSKTFSDVLDVNYPKGIDVYERWTKQGIDILRKIDKPKGELPFPYTEIKIKEETLETVERRSERIFGGLRRLKPSREIKESGALYLGFGILQPIAKVKQVQVILRGAGIAGLTAFTGITAVEVATAPEEERFPIIIERSIRLGLGISASRLGFRSNLVSNLKPRFFTQRRFIPADSIPVPSDKSGAILRERQTSLTGKIPDYLRTPRQTSLKTAKIVSDIYKPLQTLEYTSPKLSKDLSIYKIEFPFKNIADASRGLRNIRFPGNLKIPKGTTQTKLIERSVIERFGFTESGQKVVIARSKGSLFSRFGRLVQADISVPRTLKPSRINIIISRGATESGKQIITKGFKIKIPRIFLDKRGSLKLAAARGGTRLSTATDTSLSTTLETETTSTTLETDFTFLSEPLFAPIVFPDIDIDQRTRGTQRENQREREELIPALRIKSDIFTGSDERMRLSERFKPDIGIDFDISIKSDEALRQEQKDIQAQDDREFFTPIIKLDIPSPDVPGPNKPRPPKKQKPPEEPIPSRFVGFDFPSIKPKPKSKKAYHAYATIKNKEVKLTKQPLPKNKAFNVMSEVVDNTRAITGRIKKTNKLTKIDDIPFRKAEFKFKENPKGTFTELPPFRMDSLQERGAKFIKPQKIKSVQWF